MSAFDLLGSSGNVLGEGWSGHDDRRERGVRQEWEPEDLIDVWVLLEEDQQRLRKPRANRLGFALLLTFFEVGSGSRKGAWEIPVRAVSCVAQQVKAAAEERAVYDWSGRATKRHRMGTRGAFGFRECTEDDQARLAERPAVELRGVELSRTLFDRTF